MPSIKSQSRGQDVLTAQRNLKTWDNISNSLRFTPCSSVHHFLYQVQISFLIFT